MKKFAYLPLVLFAALAACGPTQTPEQKAQSQANAAKNDAIWSTRKTYDMEGATIQLAVSPDRDYALFWPTNTKQAITIGQVERGVDRVTGCKSTFDGLLLMIANGNRDAVVPFDKFGNVKGGMHIGLKC